MRILFFSNPDSKVFPSSLDLAEHITYFHHGFLDDLNEAIRTLRPDVLLVGGYDNTSELVGKLEAIGTSFPELAIVLQAENLHSDFLIQVMRLGVREVISDSSTGLLKDVISRLSARTHVSKKAMPNRKARIIGFMSAKGGDGGTCVAANIATAIAKDLQKKILVIDLSLPFGDIEMFLTNQKQPHDLADFSDEISRLDIDLMDSMVTHITDNLDLIPAPVSVDRLINIKVEHIDKIIEISSSGYDFVMIDIGAGIDPISIHALGELNELIVVATMTVPSVKRATQVLKYWSGLGLDAAKLSLVVNRYSSRSDIKIPDIEKAMNRKVRYCLPQDDSGVQESLLKGTPLINLRPKSEFSRAIVDWASDWSGQEKGKSLWHRLKIK